MSSKQRLFGNLLGAFALSLVAVSAQAAPIVLKVASPWPAKHPANIYGPELFMKEVTDATHGAVKFEFYPAGQLGKPETALQLVRSGGIDLLLAAAPYTPDKLPLSEVGGLPGMGTSACQVSGSISKLLGPDGILTKVEYGPLGLHPLYDGSPPAYEVMTSHKRVTNIADMKGLRLKAAGGPEADALRALGAVPVQMNSVDVYQSVETGVLDGRIGPYASVPALHEEKIFHYGTVGAAVGNFVAVFVINENKWKSLPKNVQVAIEHAARSAQETSCKFWDETGEKAVHELSEKDGWQFYHLTAKQKQHWLEVMEPVQKKWADGMDHADKPGTKVLEAMKAALRETP
jgi:TRAP-type C4-dicarboxylate transport system substrate-binding protein